MKDDLIYYIRDGFKLFALKIVLVLFVLLKRFDVVETLTFNMAYRDNQDYIKDYTLKLFGHGIIVDMVIGTAITLIIISVVVLINVII